MRVLYAILLLLAPTTLLAQTNSFSIKPGFVISQAPLPPQAPVVKWSPTCRCDEGLRCICGTICPCPAPVKQTADHGWKDMGAGYQQHFSGYYYHPSVGVYWPEPVRPVVQPMFQPMSFGGFGNCGPGG